MRSMVVRRKATKSDWKNLSVPEAFVNINYTRSFSEVEYNRMSYGLIPREMEDKWFIYLEDGVLSFHRSWTGHCLYRVVLQKEGDGYSVVAALANASEDQALPIDENYAVQLLEFLISNLLLGDSKPFPISKEFSDGPAGAFQHHISGTAFPEKLVDDED
jgi:hypothetical protein